jgi:HEPN domain-containing protein
VKNLDLGRDYVERATRRLKAVDLLHAERGWADVVRESQEVVELALKGLLRHCDVEVPRVHDVSDILRENAERLPKPASAALDEICEISRRLRRDRGLAFDGSEDLTPSEKSSRAGRRSPPIRVRFGTSAKRLTPTAFSCRSAVRCRRPRSPSSRISARRHGQRATQFESPIGRS